MILITNYSLKFAEEYISPYDTIYRGGKSTGQ